MTEKRNRPQKIIIIIFRQGRRIAIHFHGRHGWPRLHCWQWLLKLHWKNIDIVGWQMGDSCPVSSGHRNSSITDIDGDYRKVATRFKRQPHLHNDENRRALSVALHWQDRFTPVHNVIKATVRFPCIRNHSIRKSKTHKKMSRIKPTSTWHARRTIK